VNLRILPGLAFACPLVFLALFSGAVLSHSPGARVVVGTAYDKDTGSILYTEHHSCTDEGRICTVQYRDTAGVTIANKTLDYRHSLFSPALTMSDFRADLELTLPAGADNNVVVDAGFDNYVRSIWKQLELGETVRFPFLVAGFDEPISMRVGPTTSGSCDSAVLCLEVRIDSWLLGMLADPIELSYSRVDRTLLRFSGVSNIKGTDGESLNVDIHYRYEDEVLLGEAHAGPAARF